MGTRTTDPGRHATGLRSGMILIVAAVGLALPSSAASSARPELLASPPTVLSGEPGPGAVVRLSTTVVNRGRRAAPRSRAEVALSTDLRMDGADVALGRHVVAALGPGRRSRRT